MQTHPKAAALLLLCCLLIPAAAVGQSASCQVPGYQNVACPTTKDPSIPYCSYYDRFPYGLGFYKKELNCDLNDYGSLFQDVDRYGCCPETVQRILFQKIEAQLADSAGFTGWLGGGDITLIVSTALRLGSQSALPVGLHNLILQALGRYVNANTPLFPCPADRSNTCMEDYSIAASGFAWSALYYHLNGRPTDANVAAERAKEYIRKAYDQTYSLCLRRTSNACTQCEIFEESQASTLQSLIAQDQIEVLTYNRGENPSYGVGNLTILSAAAQALERAQRPYTVTSSLEPILAQGLFRQGQKRVGATGGCATWGSSCYEYGTCTARSCADFGYRPSMFPVKAFLAEYYSIGGQLPLILTTGYYQFNGFCSSGYSACDYFFGDGRLAFYYNLAFAWPYSYQPSLAGRTYADDFYGPMLDVDVPANMQTVTGKTFFFGWAIDRETAIASVTFTLNGTAIKLDGYHYGGARQDVCDYFGLSKCAYCPSGWAGDFDPAPYPNGTYLLRATARTVNGQTATYDRYFVINK